MRKIITALFLYVFCFSTQAQNVGIGTAAPQVTLHVLKGIQTVAPNIGSTMAVQSDGETFLQILSNDLGDQNGIYFGHTTQPISAGIIFNFSSNRELAFFTNASAPSLVLNNQGKVGIGIISPLARLHVADSNVVFTGPVSISASTTYSPPIEGAGTRMMWYPQKAAFRIGTVDGDHWDKYYIGQYSFAAGFNTQAYGSYSAAMGNNAIANGASSIATGSNTLAVGSYSTAMGSSTYALGGASTALGYGSQAMNDFTLSAGNFVTSNSYSSISLGSYNDPIVTIPTNQWVPTEPILIIGNGINTNNKSNALVILKNGNTGIGTSAPNAPLQFSNTTANRKIVFYEAANNDHQFNGFGLNPGLLRYQVNNTSDDHVFYAATTANTSNELMRIKGNGNVGIGISAPAYKLHIGSSNNSLRIEGPAVSGGVALSVGGFGELQVDKPNLAGGRLIVKDNGNVGVGTATPNSALEVNGAIATTMVRPSSTNITLDNSATVWDFAPGTTITLPNPASCPNRRYILVNRYSGGLGMLINTPGYLDFGQLYNYYIPPKSSIEIIANGNAWWQIK